MLYHPYIVQATFIAMGLALMIHGYSLRKEKISFLGKPTVNPVLFYTGKLSLFAGWGLFLYRSIVISSQNLTGSQILQWIATIILCLAAIVLVFAFKALGKSLRVGLPDEQTKLMTTGIYRLSRNPLYLGVFMVCIASCLYYPVWFNIIFALYGMLAHYLIILGEEKFLEQRFVSEWREYRKKVRRII
jgi:protein-S-isoprenylcysteine O-methyltransferase Ste14